MTYVPFRSAARLPTQVVVQLLTEATGLLASISGFLVWLPQARRVWRDRRDPARLTGISLQTQALSLVGNVLWLVHAIGIGSFWLAAPSAVNIPVVLMTIVVVRRAQRCSAGAAAVLVAHEAGRAEARPTREEFARAV